LEKLILGKRVKIVRVGVDNFKRLIALVYLGDQLVNETVLANGWGKYDSSSGTDPKITALLKEKSREAKENHRGVWSEKCYQKINPENPQCDIKGNLGKHDNKKIYHYPGCSGLFRI